MFFFTSDLHFDHTNIIKHCDRPFKTIDEMNEALIYYWNITVDCADIVIIAGDVTLHSNTELVYKKFLNHLKGNLILLRGNHDYWMKEKRYLYHKKVMGQAVAVGHYPMRSWHNSSHGSWNLHGHSHGTMPPLYNQLDIGVDSAAKLLGQYRPFSFNEVKEIMEEQPDGKQIIH
jgi:calcineurin-like phosphoesterase family protein